MGLLRTSTGDEASQKLPVVLNGHDDIDIIIPGNEPLVPNRTEKSAGTQRISQIVLSTIAVENAKEAQLGSFHLLHG